MFESVWSHGVLCMCVSMCIITKATTYTDSVLCPSRIKLIKSAGQPCEELGYYLHFTNQNLRHRMGKNLPKATQHSQDLSPGSWLWCLFS